MAHHYQAGHTEERLLRDRVIEHLEALFEMHQDLAESLPEEALGQKLPVPSNTMGAQFWCLIGTRESFARAIKEDGWQGWSCSMSAEDSHAKQRVSEKLTQTAQQVVETLSGIEWTDYRDGALLDLLEHETQHQGQLIRYVYGLKHEFPKSLADRWAL